MKADARRRARRRLLLAGLPLLIVALGVAGKVSVMVTHDRDGRAGYAAGEYDEARAAFADNGTLNVIETWVSPYDEGTARYRLADFSGAVRSLEIALTDVPSDEECRVRINLALAHEAVGDAAAADGDLENGVAEWQDGLDVLQEGGCPVLKEESEAGVGSSSPAQVRDVRTVADRLRDKLRSEDDRRAAALDAASQAQAELLEERNDEAKRDRRKLEEKKQDQSDAPPDDPPGSGDGSGEDDAPTYYW